MKEVRQTKMPESSPVKPAVFTEWRTDERNEPGWSGVTTAGVNHHGPLPVSVPDHEVLESPRRRRFTAAYKLRILQEADALSKSGQIGTLLRREGLYSSHLTTLAAATRYRPLEALRAQKWGPKAHRPDPLLQENDQLRRKITSPSP